MEIRIKSGGSKEEIIEELTTNSRVLEYNFVTYEEKIKWVKQFLDRVRYKSIKSKKIRGQVIKIIRNTTNLSNRSIFNWLKKYRGEILKSTKYQRHKFSKIYSTEDILLLSSVDNQTERISAASTKKLLVREYNKFGNEKFKNISAISISHIKNLRRDRIYVSNTRHFDKTHSNKSNFLPIGKMVSNGIPGYIRVDTVHSGIFNEQKGLYYINMIDDVVQTEYVYTVPVISERFLAPLLEYMLNEYWTKILGFHSDGGSEYNNDVVSSLLNKLYIGDTTRSRPYHSNDNALVETKNSSIIRKHFGFGYIPKEFHKQFNEYLKIYFNSYLNFHRSCGYLTETRKSKKNRTVRIYGEYNPPYERFKERYIQHLKPNLKIDQLDTMAYSISDYESAKLMKINKDKLFKDIFNTTTKL